MEEGEDTRDKENVVSSLTFLKEQDAPSIWTFYLRRREVEGAEDHILSLT